VTPVFLSQELSLMRSKFAPLSLGVLAIAAACTDAPMGVASSNAPAIGSASQTSWLEEIVLTVGARAPGRPEGVGFRPTLSEAAPVALGSNATGSFTTPLVLTPSNCAATATGTVSVTFRVTGAQAGNASFDVPTTATFDGTSWSYTDLVTKSVPGPRTGSSAALDIAVPVTVVNASAAGAGTALQTSYITPENITNSNSTGGKLADPISAARIYVGFADCAVTNTPPRLTLPANIVEEALSASGNVVNYSVLVSDDQETGLVASCSPASGSTFAIGTTTVNCSVTDDGGMSATGSFTVNIRDTTAPSFTSIPTGTITLVADNINGASFDIGAQGITVADWNAVSEPSTFSCTGYTAGTPVALEIGSTTVVSCKAKDARNNEQTTASTFSVFVGLDVSATGFLSPLRMVAPYSGHKLGSTIPHKVPAPKYADGSLAIDLASGLNLTLNKKDNTVDAVSSDVLDFSAGSTEWRYDATCGCYIFNAKSGTSNPWSVGSWMTTAAYKGIKLATTQLEFKK
jgi:hypothetical protein